MSLDAAKATFDQLRAEANATRSAIETEADARFRLVNRILTDVLGWPFADIRTEAHVEDGYVDYLLIDQSRNKLVVEAKRQAAILVDTRSPAMGNYKVSGPALKSADEALRQVEMYCFHTGTPFAVVTNGFEWIATWPIRGDGKPRTEHKAIVFPNLEAIAQSFADFFDLFSRQGVLADLYRVKINEAEGLAFGSPEPLRVIRDQAPRMLRRSDLARDLERLFAQFFESMSGESDPEMLAKCFVETKESKHADVSLEKIARHLTNGIVPMDSDQAKSLQNEIQDAVEAQRGEFVLIIGNKGAGKTTFVDRFFRLVLDRALRDKCLVLRLDLRDSDGDLDKAPAWLTERLIDCSEAALFSNRNLSFEDLQGIFHKKYKRWAEGEYRALYETDKQQFKIRFGDYIVQLRKDNPGEYLTHLLWHAVKARRNMPCLIFDNTDHFPQVFQESVFQFAQSLHRQIFSFVICPITDRTIWQLSKAGPLQSYETKAFYLPVPSTREVLQKRITFLRDKIQQTTDKHDSYFLSRGIRLEMKNIQAFAACIEDAFINTEYFVRTVSWLCNHDIRRSLQLSRRVLLSPHVEIDELVKTFLAGGRLRINEFHLRRALILGDYNGFNQTDSAFVLNLFEVYPDALGSPFARPSILQVLKDKSADARDSDEHYVEVGDLIAYLEPAGLPSQVLQKHMQALAEHRLVEPYDPTTLTLSDSTRVKITPSGLIHLEFVLSDSVYMEQLALATPLRSNKDSDALRQVRGKGHALAHGEWNALSRLFVEYLKNQDSAFCKLPEQYQSQRSLREQCFGRWASVPPHTIEKSRLRQKAT